MTKSVETRSLLQKAGFDAKILSGGSTGTYNIDSALDGVTELQVGSYVFMDVDYRRIGGGDSEKNYNQFQPILTRVSALLKSTHPGRVHIDAGIKTLHTATPQLPQA